MPEELRQEERVPAAGTEGCVDYVVRPRGTVEPCGI